MAQAPGTDRPKAEQISFELESLTVNADDRLELTGRWFGVRGRRFVRPTLTLIGEHKRSRSLADLEHKPWAAEDGTDWVAAFPLQAPGEDVLELELAVAPDIAVSLAPPPELAQLPRERKPSSNAVVAPRSAPPSRPGTPVPEGPAQPAKRKPPARRAAAAAEAAATATATAEAAAAQDTIEQQRLKIQSLEEELERAAGSEVELRSALGRRDAAVEKLEAVLEQQAVQERERAAAEQDREGTERERLSALRERDEARQGWKEAHQGWGAAVRERDRIAQEREQALIERDRAMASRDQLITELDRVASERDQLVSELDRVRTERDRAVDERDRATGERDRALAERDQTRTERARAPVPRPLITTAEHRPRVHASMRARGSIAWITRLFALLVLAGAVAAIIIIIRAA